MLNPSITHLVLSVALHPAFFVLTSLDLDVFLIHYECVSTVLLICATLQCLFHVPLLAFL